VTPQDAATTSRRHRERARSRYRTLIATAIIAPLIAAGLAACSATALDEPASASAAAPTAVSTPSVDPSPSPAAAIVTAAPSAPPSASPSPAIEASNDAQITPSPELGTAEAAALALVVKGRSAKTGYDRDEFGNAWVDVDRNGCDTRNDMLILRLEDRDMSGDCKVLSGDLADPFTGTWIHFERGGESEVDIDHLVALSDAWQKGASSWEFAKRVAFANDPLNLEPVDAGANRQKGDGDAATWLPASKEFRCEYVARQVAVKTKYELWVTQAEQDAMVDVLSGCEGEPLPDAGDQSVIADNIGEKPQESEPQESPTATKPTKSEQPPAASSEDELDERFEFCNRLPAGYGPYVRGEDPEYGWYTDRDGDGVVCE
jgi:hypothetical protein